jgi:predicted SAM-dependent methyltransferase
MSSATQLRKLNWGCGGHTAEGWINSDQKAGPGINLSCDIKEGLPLDDASVDYAVSIHALVEVAYPELISVLQELRRVLKPGGVLRLCLPDLLKGVAAYHRNDRNYFAIPDEDVKSIGSKLVLQLIWYGYSRTLFTEDFIEEMLLKAGFSRVHRCQYQQTKTSFADITILDNRENESLYVEAVK